MLTTCLAKVLAFHLFLGLQNGRFPRGFRTKILFLFIVSPILDTCPAHCSLSDFTILTPVICVPSSKQVSHQHKTNEVILLHTLSFRILQVDGMITE